MMPPCDSRSEGRRGLDDLSNSRESDRDGSQIVQTGEPGRTRSAIRIRPPRAFPTRGRERGHHFSPLPTKQISNRGLSFKVLSASS